MASKAQSLSTATHFKSQQEQLSHRLPEDSFWGHPTDKQVETGSLSLVNPEVQKLIPERGELKIWRDEEKKEGSDCHLNSLTNMFKSLGDEQDTLWSMKGKPEKLLGPEKHPHPETFGTNLQQKCSQFFWGLPFLHSESLVATVRETPPEFPSVIFNEFPHALPLQIRRKVTSHLTLAQPLPHPVTQPKLLTPAMPQFQPPPLAQIQTQTQLAPFSPPPTRTSGVSCPTSQDKARSFLPTSIQDLEPHFWKKQLEGERSLPFSVKKSEAVFSQLSANLPQDKGASHTHGPVSLAFEDVINPEILEQLEQHLLKRFVQHIHVPGLPHWIQLSLELPQLEGEFPQAHQARGKQGTFQPSAVTGKSSQDAEKIGYGHPAMIPPRMDLGKDVGHNVGRIMRDLHRGSASCPVKALGVSSDESEGDLVNTPTMDPEKVLRVHSVSKLGQISEGPIPTDVHHSRITGNYALELPRESNAHREARNPASSMSWESCMNTSREVFIRHPHARQLLEAHIKSFWVRHRWGLPLKVLKPVKLFKLKKAQPSPLRWSFFTHSATSASGAHSKAKFTKSLGKPPQLRSGEKLVTEGSVPGPQLFPGDRVITDDSVPGPQPLLGDKVITEESGPAVVSPPLAPSPACGEIQKDLVERPPGDDHGSSENPLIGQMGRLSSQSLTRPLVGRVWHNEIATEGDKDSLEPNPSSVAARNEPRKESGGQTSRDAQLELNSESQSSRAKEARKAARAKEAPAWGVTLEPCVNLRRSKSPESSKTRSLPTNSVSQDPAKPCPSAQLSELEFQRLVESENHPQGHATTVLLQDCETGALLQDCATDTLLQRCHSDGFLAADVLASRGSPFRSKSISSGDVSASKVLYDFISRGGSSQQESLRLHDQSKSQSKMSDPAYEKEDNRRLNPGEHKERLAEMRTSQAGGISAALDKKSEESLRRKPFQLMQKEQPPPESFLKNRIKYFLQWMFPGKDKGPKDDPQKGQPASATDQSSEPVKSGSIMGSRAAEAQVLVTAVGQILEEKVALHHGLCTSEVNWCEGELQAPAGPHLCYQRALSYKEQRRLMQNMADDYPFTSNGHTYPTKSRWTRDRDSKWVFPPRELGFPEGPYQHELRVTRPSGQIHCCPAHCPLQNYVSLGQPECAPHAFPGSNFLQEKMYTMQRETFFSC